MLNSMQTAKVPTTELYTLQLPSRPASIIQLESLIENIADKHQVADDTFANMMTCLSEAVINAMVHGNQLDTDKLVIVNAEVDQRRIVWTVTDEGEGFSPNQLPDPTAPENLEALTGRGVFIMKQLADQCIFNDRGNEIELHFKI